MIIPNYEIGINNNDGEANNDVMEDERNQFENRNNNINIDLQNQGYIKSIKQKQNIRIMAVNPNKFGPENKEKLEMMCQIVKELEIDMVLLSAPDRRWTTSRIEKLAQNSNK